MIETRRLCFDYIINSRPVQKYDGLKVYVSTGDSDDIEKAGYVSYYNRPSRANVQPIKGDIIFAKMANTDKTFIIDEKLANNIYSTGFFDISSTKINTKFLGYIIKSHEFDSYKNAYSEGTTQVSISDKRLRKIKITYETDIFKQEKIATYLDNRVSKIKKLVDNLELQIHTLKDFKYNLITQTVKLGLDPKIKINSNIAWIGEMNSEFNIGIIKHDFILRGRIGWQGLTTNDYKDEGPYLITGTDFVNGQVCWDNCVHISEKRFDEDVNIHVKEDDLLITKDGTVGKIAIALNCPEQVSLNSGIMLIKPRNKECLTQYLRYVLESGIFWNWYYFSQRGNATIMHLYQDQFGYFKYPLPPLEEQERIARYLKKKCDLIDKLIDIKMKKMDMLNKLITSLIYEYVSGKKEAQ